MTEPGNINIKDAFPSGSHVKIDEGERLKLARQVLFWLALICIGTFISYGLYPDNEGVAGIFELIKIGALPLATLVISFYFPKSMG